LPLWVASGMVFWGVILVYGLLAVSPLHWYLVPGMGFFALAFSQKWSQRRREHLFQSVVRPRLDRTMSRGRLRPPALLAGISHHSEWRTPYHGLVGWSPDGARRSVRPDSTGCQAKAAPGRPGPGNQMDRRRSVQSGVVPQPAGTIAASAR